MIHDAEYKKMPFVEEEGYVERLVQQVTDRTVSQRRKSMQRTVLVRLAASIAAVAIIGGASSRFLSCSNILSPDSPLDSFLAGLSDDEASQLDYYDIEEYYAEEQ